MKYIWNLKIVLFQPSLPQYRLPIFQSLSNEKEIDLTIFYGSVKNLSNVDPDGLKANQLNTWKFSLFGEPVFVVWKRLFATLFGDYDVFAFTWDPHYLFLVPALLLARLRGKGTVLWGHGYSKSEVAWKRKIRLFIGKLANVIVLYNRGAAQDLIREGFDFKRIFVAPNTQDQSEIQKARKYWLSKRGRLKEFQRQKGISSQHAILFCSRLEAANRVDWLIEAHSRLIKSDSNLKLIIIGHGPEEETLKKQALDLGIKDSVLFLGSIYDQNQLAPWFLSVGVFCYPRNIGLSILHAFGYGLPAVTSDKLSAQNPEVEALRSGKNGFYYQDGNIDDLAEKLKSVLNNSKLRQKLGVEARRTALEDYPIENMVQGLKGAFLAAAARQGIEIKKTKPSKVSANKNPLAILFERVGPYHDARLKTLGKYFDVSCVESCRQDETYGWNVLKNGLDYQKITLFEDGRYLRQPVRLIRKKVEQALERIQPSAVAIPGWSNKTALTALAWCSKNNVPAILMTDSTKADHKRWFFPEFVKRNIVPFFSSAVVSGSKSRDYVAGLGMPSTIVSLGCDVVDNDYFKRETEKTRRSAVSLRKKYDLPQNYFLSSGRFVEKKNFDFLLRSYAAYVKNVKKPWGFVLLGDGPLRKDFEKIARNLSVGSLLKMPGFIQYEQLPIYYGLAKSFILPSSMDQWGLVVNEAMASGLPVLVSNCCGCSFDLVQEGKNGWSFNPRDESQLTMLLEDLTRMSGVKRNFIGSKSSKIIENWSTDQFAEGIKKAAEDDFPITKTTALNRTLLELVIRYDRDWWHS